MPFDRVCRWMEKCLKEELPATTELEEAFRNGVFLAKLGNFFSPETIPLRKIFDKDFKVLKVSNIPVSCLPASVAYTLRKLCNHS